MAGQSYALAVGHNNAAGLMLIDNLIYDRCLALPAHARRIRLQADPVPAGSVEKRTLDKKQHWDGAQIVEWRHSVIPLDGLTAIITVFLGSISTDNASVTLRTRLQDNTFANFNAEYDLPTGYQIKKGIDGVQYALNVVHRFSIVSAL